GPVRAVLLGDHVRRRALVDVQLADTAGDGGDDLDRARPGTDHSHPLAIEIDLVVPARGVEDRALEAFRALDPPERRAAELSAGRDQHVGLEGLPRSSLDSPAARALVELRPSHLRPQPQVAPQPMAIDAALEVVEDLRLWRVAPAPVRVGLERERVELRGDVTGRTRVGVVAPDTADAFGFLQQGDRGDPTLF